MERIKNGDRLAFTRIYQRYWRMLYLHSFKMLQDEQEALDVVQNLFTALWEQVPHLQIQNSVRSYLFRAVRNHTLNAIAKSKTRRQHTENFSRFLEASRPLLEESINFKELSARIEREVENLPEKMRTIFLKSQQEDKSQKMIAAELDISENTVRTVMYRARMILRKRLTSFLCFMLPWFF